MGKVNPAKRTTDRAGAVRLARRLGCEGAHQLDDGSWAPCATPEALTTVVREGADGYKKWKREQSSLKNGDRERGVAGIDSLPGGGLVSGKSALSRAIDEYRNALIEEKALGPMEVKARNAQSVPAKPSERVTGSDKNPAGTAGSRTAASDIELTPQLVEALKKKVADHNESMRQRSAAPHRMATLPMLKAVLRRGMGAYSVSHRPNVGSRQQWGMARVNAFLKLLASGKPSDPKYVSDNDLLPSGHERATGRS